MERKRESFRKRNSYYDDYRKNAAGEYVYTGPTYEFVSTDGKSRAMWVGLMLLMSIAAAVVQLFPGFFLVPGLNNSAYVSLAYTAGILGVVYLLVIVIRLAAAKDTVKAWEYDRSVKVLPRTTLVLAIIGAANIVCEIIYVIVSGADGKWTEFAVYIACNAVFAVITYIMYRFTQKAEWKRVKDENV